MIELPMSIYTIFISNVIKNDLLVLCTAFSTVVHPIAKVYQKPCKKHIQIMYRSQSRSLNQDSCDIL